MEKKNRLLIVVSIILAVAAIVLLLISIFGHFEKNWVLTAGLACVLLGNICNFISIRRNRKTDQRRKD